MKSVYYVILFISISWIVIAQPARFESRGIGGGAEIYSLTISPSTPYTLRATSSESPLIVSTDLGVSWNTTHYASIAGGNYAGKMTFTASPAIIYSISDVDGDFIPVKSTDGGRSWVKITDPTFGGAYYIHADPSTTNRLILSDYTDVYFSNDGGITWTFAFSEETPGADGCYIAGTLFDGTYIMVATQAGIYTSDDDGLTFFKDDAYAFPTETGIVEFTYGQMGALFRMTCITAPMELLYPGVTIDHFSAIDEVYTMDAIDGVLGDWVARKSSLPSTFQPLHCIMPINEPSKILLAGITSTGKSSIMKSTNGGNSFVSIFNSDNNANIATGWIGSGSNFDWQYAGYPISFAMSRLNPQIMAIGDYASLHTSSDGGNSWKQGYVKTAGQQSVGSIIEKDKFYQSNGFENTIARTVLWSDSTTVLAGYDVHGIVRSNDNGNSWSKPIIPSQYQHCYGIIKNGTALYALVCTIADLYSISKVSDNIIDKGKSAILKSTDNGKSWSILKEFDFPAFSISQDAQNSAKVFIAAVHSVNGGYYVIDQINESTEWKKLTSPTRTEGHPHSIISLQDGNLICTYTARRSGTEFTKSSGVFYSTDNGNTWSDKSEEYMKTWTTSISVDPHDSYQHTWYASTWSNPLGTNDNSGGVYKTTDRGNSWNKIITLPAKEHNLYRVNACAVNPANPNQMFVTTATHGLYFTNTLKNASPLFNELSTTFPVRNSSGIFFNPRAPWEMAIATSGNGLRFGTNAIPQIPIMIAHSPIKDTIITYKQGNRPSLTILTATNAAQTFTKAEARFSLSANFSSADTISIFDTKSNHVPANVPGADSVWYMQARIGNQQGWGSWTNAIRITFKMIKVNGINDEITSKYLFPNPVQSLLTFSNICSCYAEIYSVTGTLVWKGTIDNSVNVESLSNGAYILRTFGKDAQSMMFIKQQ